MKTIRTTMAVALIGLALTAFQSDALAQARRVGSTSGTSRSTSTSVSRSTPSSRSTSGSKSVSSASKQTKSNATVSRSSGVKSATRPAVSTSTDRKPGRTTGSKPSTTVTKPVKPVTSTSATRPTGQTVRPTGQTSRPSGTSVKPATKPSAVTRPSGGTTSGTVTRPVKQDKRPDFQPGNQTKPVTVSRPGHRPGDRKPDKPVQIRPDHKPDVRRVHPRDRDFMHYSAPSYYWTGHNHCYGHRVRVLPTHVHRHVHYGVTYYCYNDIWYRPYGGYYVVCRPPFGTVLAANLIADMTWAAINFSYYNTVAQTYSQINENNAYIAEQNAIIAQNNATIAAQNAQIAAGQQQAQVAYTLANQLGLVQSYAAAGSTYYYQDGVFYAMDANGEYKVIVPPAGALVETLPEDFDLVTLSDGNEYYKVDDTIYKITIVDGKPYFEVLGQLYI